LFAGYICGLDRYQFEKNADGFMNHIDRDHDLWNYLHYIHYLENKDKTEYNGIESFVVEKMKKMEIEW
jgi:inositol 1,4,5-triphosphate receptor type 1/inositol 1,4,5-triphosphate receptor type 3